MPELKKVHESYKGQGLVLIGIHCDKDIAKRNEIVKQKKLTYPICQDVANGTQKAYFLEGYPTVYLIDKKGFVRAVDPADLGKAVKAALAQKK
jgi:hypothetical protein